MNILVCIKQVPLAKEVQIDPETNTLVREGVPSIVNPSDLNALEAALKLKDTQGAMITVVSMGPRQAENAVIQCLRMGADEGVLLSDKAFAGSDTLATALVLSKFIKNRKKHYNLILCGHESIDGNTGQVGPEIAELLNMNHISWVKSVECTNSSKSTIRVVRKMGRSLQTLETPLPVLITILRDTNVPRSPEGNSESVEILGAGDIDCKEEVGLAGSPTKVTKIFPPKPIRKFHPPIDSHLPARKRIELILDGGIVAKEKHIVMNVDEIDEHVLANLFSTITEMRV